MAYDGQLGDLRPPYRWRTHQRGALRAIEQAERAGSRRAWVVLPPGAGKTLVGIETARRRSRTTLVLSPNTAVQGQWMRAWDAGRTDRPAGSGRDLEGPFTALTYQALATFQPDGDDPTDDERLLDTLHPNGRALVDRLKAVGDLTLVLDECHHLLEVWGRLLDEVLAELPDAFVLGLTATPATTLTRDQATLVDSMFGTPLFTASIPAVVREGDLAPFAELAWLTTPTPSEADWLAAQGERFTELTTALTDPTVGSTGFLTWLDLSTEQGEVRDAALRMVHAGLLRLPPGARLREQHRHAPTADDWAELLGGWVAHLRATGDDDEVLEEIRQVLPSVGYQLTRTGIRRGRSPVDRVLARSEAKIVALTEIVGAEHRTLGDRLRMLVISDHERANATGPREGAGSATLALEHLHRAHADLHPLLVTASTVAGSTETLQHLREYAGRPDLEIRDGRLEGGWTSRQWVPWVTRFFEAGHTQVLVGTRGLLGEGWDARAVTGLVDLTTATTSTAVVQTRGRALRTDPHWPEKVAITWTVVCVSEDHPRGANDWDRFVRKHADFFGVDAEGDVVSGVAHVDAAFSPYAPPPADSFDEVNARMLLRAERRQDIHEAWAVGSPYDDEVVHTVRITTPRPQREVTEPPAAVLHGREVVVRDDRPSPWRPHPVVAAALVLGMVGYLLHLAPSTVLGIVVATMLGIQTTIAVDRGRVLAEDLARPPTLTQVAHAVADGLRAAGLSPVGADAVRVRLDDHLVRRCWLEGVDAEVSETFATALDEVVSPMTEPRYVLPRWVLSPPVDNAEGFRLALHLLRPDGEVWHSVPTVLGTTGERAQHFARAWDHWVGGGPAIYTGSPAGEGVLVTHRGADPFDVTTVLRTRWR